MTSTLTIKNTWGDMVVFGFGGPTYQRDMPAGRKTFLFLDRQIILDNIFLNGYILF